MSDNAKQNAAAWLANLHQMVAALALAENAGDHDAADACRTEIEESPLSVTVRGGWHTPGDVESTAPEEFQILLTTGGPALRIVGEFGPHYQPEDTRLEWQDWGTPWTRLATTEDDDEALETYCQQFWFGE